MKNSGIEWIGEIPDSWKYFRLKDYYLFEKGKNAAIYTQDYIGLNKGDYPVYSGQTENEGVMGMIDTFDYDIDECLFTTTVGAKVMTPKILRGKFSLSQNCLIMKKTKECNNSYIYYYLFPLFSYAKSLIPTYMQPSLRVADLNLYGFYVPDCETQYKIAKCLNEKCGKIDELIANQEKQIDKLKEYKQSVITEAVTKGLDKSAPMKDSGVEWIGEIPQQWKICPLKTLFSFGKGLPITKENLVEEGVAVISYGQIHAKWNSGVLTHKELYRYVSEKYLETNSESLVKKGDLIMADTSEDKEGCGNCAYIDTGDMVFAGYHTITLKSLTNYNTKYLAYLFLTDHWRSQLRKSVSGVKLFSVSKRILGTTTVLIPHNPEEIIIWLDNKCAKIDRLIANKQEKIEKLQEYKKSLIYEYVTGKKEAV